MIRKIFAAAALVALPAAVIPLIAQSAPAQPAPMALPGKPDYSRVTSGTYAVDPAHTLIGFTVDHLGFNPYFGIFGNPTGTLTIDPAKVEQAKVAIDIPLSGLLTTSADLNKHLFSKDFFDAETHPTARFVSTAIRRNGADAEITGDLTIRGITKPVTLKANFTGAGIGPMNKAETIGFRAMTMIKRSDFGVSFGIPMVSDQVELTITVAFEKLSPAAG